MRREVEVEEGGTKELKREREGGADDDCKSSRETPLGVLIRETEEQQGDELEEHKEVRITAVEGRRGMREE